MLFLALVERARDLVVRSQIQKETLIDFNNETFKAGHIVLKVVPGDCPERFRREFKFLDADRLDQRLDIFESKFKWCIHVKPLDYDVRHTFKVSHQLPPVLLGREFFHLESTIVITC